MDYIYGDLIEINDEKYTQIINDYMANLQRGFSSNSNIILNGYFQKSSNFAVITFNHDFYAGNY